MHDGFLLQTHSFLRLKCLSESYEFVTFLEIESNRKVSQSRIEIKVTSIKAHLSSVGSALQNVLACAQAHSY